jgi:hypothetical protein
LKVEDIAYNVEKQKNYIGDIVGIRVQNILYFILFLEIKGHLETW